MVTSDKFLGQLHYYAESFTGMPTRIIAPNTGQQDTLAQTEGFTRIFIPYEVKPTSMQYEEDLGLVVYKGIVALQASAARYNGVPDKETIKTGEYQKKLGALSGGLSLLMVILVS